MPVVARPDTRWYRVSKFVRRNALPVSLAAAAALALVAGSIATFVMSRIARAEADRAITQAEIREAAQEYLTGIFGELDPETLGGLARPDQGGFTVDDLMERALANLEQLSSRPELYAVVANTLAKMFFNLNQTQRADSLFRRAYEILEPLGNHQDLAVSMIGIGEVARRMLRFEEAEHWFRDALRVREQAFPPDDPHIAETLALLAFALYNQEDEVKLAEADRLYTRAQAFGDTIPVTMRARILEGFGDIRIAQENYGEAESYYRQSLELRKTPSGVDPSTARLLWGLGRAIAQEGNTWEALAVYEEARDALVAAFGDWHRDVAFARYLVGRTLLALDSLERAEYEMSLAARASARVNPPDFLYTGDAWNILGRIQTERERFPQAVESFDSALAVFSRHPIDPALEKNEAQYYYDAVYRRGIVWSRMGEHNRAVADLTKAHAMFAGALANGRSATDAAGELARLYQRTGPPDSAAVWARRAGITSPGGT
jgi:serine/threonine-protein kinase